jgi:hypothetical protein
MDQKEFETRMARTKTDAALIRTIEERSKEYFDFPAAGYLRLPPVTVPSLFVAGIYGVWVKTGEKYIGRASRTAKERAAGVCMRAYKEYVVTHLPTGARVAGLTKKKDAIDLCRLLAAEHPTFFLHRAFGDVSPPERGGEDQHEYSAIQATLHTFLRERGGSV